MGATRPFAHHLIRHLGCRRGQRIEDVGTELDDAASAGRVDGADTDVGSGFSALSSTFQQIELSSTHAPREHHPQDWLQREDGQALLQREVDIPQCGLVHGHH